MLYLWQIGLAHLFFHVHVLVGDCDLDVLVVFSIDYAVQLSLLFEDFHLVLQFSQLFLQVLLLLHLSFILVHELIFLFV